MNENRIKFPSNLNYDVIIVREMGPGAISNSMEIPFCCHFIPGNFIAMTFWAWYESAVFLRIVLLAFG